MARSERPQIWGRRWRLAYAAGSALVLFAAELGHAQSLDESTLALRPGVALPEPLPPDVAAEVGDDVTGALGPRRGSGRADDASRIVPRPLPIGAASESNHPMPDASAASGASATGFDSLNRKRSSGQLAPGRAAPPEPAARPSPNKPRVPVSASVAGIADGQPPRRPLTRDPDPFGATGFYVGTFLAKAAVELTGGYDTNPGRFFNTRGSAFMLVAPELLINSNWSRHALNADLRGSFTHYGSTFPLSSGVPGPVVLDRPDFTGRVNGRIDVSRDTRVVGEWRSRIATDNPGSPNIEVGLTEYPLFFANGFSAGVEQDINRLRLSALATVDRTVYQQSKLTDGTRSNNNDRAYTQYGGIGRMSYEINPALRPFVEVQGDSRVHDARMDRFGFLRDSNGGYIKVGSTFELTRLISGEAAIGYTTRAYEDPRLRRIGGLLTSGSLIWTPTGLTTVRLSATSSVDETTLPGVSGVLTRGFGLQVDHDFRRWLTGTLRFAYGTADYDGATRSDRTYSVGGDLVYKMSRTVHIKATARHDWLESNVPGANSAATVVMLGVRLQR